MLSGSVTLGTRQGGAGINKYLLCYPCVITPIKLLPQDSDSQDMGSLTEFENKDFYQILNVERKASVEQIREAYKEIAKIYHPDSNFYAEIIQTQLSPEDLSRFKRITAAYNTLVNPEKRDEYDRTLLQGILPDWDAESSDPFSSGAGTNASRQQQGPFMRKTGFGQPPPSSFGAEESAASVLEIIDRGGPHPIVVHLLLGITAGGILSMLILFVLGYF